MNDRAGFAYQQFVDLPYNWDYNGSALVNTVLRTTDNNTDPVGYESVIVVVCHAMLCPSCLLIWGYQDFKFGNCFDSFKIVS